MDIKNKKLYLSSTLAALALAWTVNANAIPVVTSGVWSSLQENDGVVDNKSGVGTNVVSWGDPATASGSSSYTFEGVNGDAPLNNSLFELGDFTHGNFAIFLPSITGATLDLNLDFTGEGVSQNFSFFFEHTETPNFPVGGAACAEGGATPCPDLVGIPDASSSETVVLQGQEYQLDILGFSQDGGNTIIPNFLTTEGQANTATLYARLVPPTSDVSEPSALMLLAVGLMGLWGSSRRKIK